MPVQQVRCLLFPALQIEDEAATSTSQQQAQLLQESHTSITAALEQIAMHGELKCIVKMTWLMCVGCLCLA